MFPNVAEKIMLEIKSKFKKIGHPPLIPNNVMVEMKSFILDMLQRILQKCWKISYSCFYGHAYQFA